MSKTDPMWVFENYVAAAELIDELERELAALKAKPSGVVLPERKPILWSAGCGHETPNHAWNACLDEVARLNSSPVIAGECSFVGCVVTDRVEIGVSTETVSTGGVNERAEDYDALKAERDELLVMVEELKLAVLQANQNHFREVGLLRAMARLQQEGINS